VVDKFIICAKQNPWYFSSGGGAEMKKYLVFLAIAILLILSLVACGGGGEELREGNVNEEFIETYIYLPTAIALPNVPERISGSLAHEDQIFYWYTDQNSVELVIVIVTVGEDDPCVIRIPALGADTWIAELRIRDAGHLTMLIVNQEQETGGGLRILYAEYGMDGREIVIQDLSDALSQNGRLFMLTYAFFADDGNMVLVARTERGDILNLLAADGRALGQLETEAFQSITQLQDGRVVAFDGHGLRVIDFAAGIWGETLPSTLSYVRNLLRTGAAYPFDFLVDDGLQLFGYDLDTGEQTPLLRWVEVGISTGWVFADVLDDGRISVLTSGWDDPAELFVLQRTPRAELAEYTIITLGGLAFNEWVLNEVVAFNRESRDYQIQLVEYWEGWRTGTGDWEAAFFRFAADLMTGDAPDIILVPHDLHDDLVNQGFLADLYPFLDADLELERSDFFLNILQAFEAPDGSLPAIANAFSLRTMIGTADSMGHIESWTLTDFLRLREEANLLYFDGEFSTGERLVLLGLEDFICREESRANIDNAPFIELLEAAAQLLRPSELPTEGQVFGSPDHARMRRGEQLLYNTFLVPSEYQRNTAALGGIVALGFPTSAGGVHHIQTQENLAISTTSTNQEAAWRFVRRLLLPDAPLFGEAFPLRIDRYEALIAEAMTPQLNHETGEEHPRFYVYIYEGLSVPVFAMTEAEAGDLRAIVESASLISRFDEALWNIVEEELQPFFAGDRTAVDTARIMQNRIQTLLSERR